MVKNYHNLLNLGAFLPKTKQIDVKCKIKKFFGPAISRYSIKPIYKTKKKKKLFTFVFSLSVPNPHYLQRITV